MFKQNKIPLWINIILPIIVTVSGLGEPKQIIESTLAPLQKTATVAMMITDLKNPEKTLFSVNESIYLQPASTMKILTSIIAQESLNQQQPFVTKMSAYGHQRQQTMTGDIVLEIGANPSFDDTYLMTMVSALKKKKIKQIDGNFIILKNHFDQVEQVPGTTWDELGDCYATSTSDISLNKNCFLLTLVRANHHITQYAPSENQPTHTDIQILDDCHDQKSANSHYPAYGHGVSLKQNPFKQPETLRGCWSKHIPYWQLKRSVQQPDQILLARLKTALKYEGIHLTGDLIVMQKKPIQQQKPLWSVTQPSAPLAQLIQTMLEKSDNHIANQLFKESAYYTSGTRASWESAQTHAQQILEKYQLNDDNGSIVDGAGLSRNNRINAVQLQRALTTIYKNPKLRPLIQLFANQHSEKSTLTKRIEHVRTPIYAKTGSLNGVIALAGFIDPYGKQPKAFTILMNGNKTIGTAYSEIEPLLLEQITAIQ